jgi:hypothetical protein
MSVTAMHQCEPAHEIRFSFCGTQRPAIQDHGLQNHPEKRPECVDFVAYQALPAVRPDRGWRARKTSA